MLGRLSYWNKLYIAQSGPPAVASTQLSEPANIAESAPGTFSGTSDSEAYWEASTIAANQAKAFIISNPNSPITDQTGIAETSQAFQDKVTEVLATGIGERIAENDAQVMQGFQSLVAEKLKLASECGLQNNTAGQVRLLLSAFGDIEWFIGTILSNFSGMELPAEAQNTIASLRKLQNTIMAQIRQATGLNLSDDELRALLEKDPSEAHQMINLSWLVREDRNLTPRLEGTDTQLASSENITPESESPTAVQSQSPSEEMIYGSHGNPAKRQKNLNTAGEKILQELKKITAAVQSLSKDSEGGQNAFQLFGLVQRGLAICMIADVCEDLFSTGSQSSGEIQQSKALFLQLSQDGPVGGKPQRPSLI